MNKPTGELRLVFRRKKDGDTLLAEQYYKLPLQIMKPHYQEGDGTPFIYLLNPGGGVLQHDRLMTEIILEDESRAFVTTQSNTKFYKMDEGHAEVVNRVTVGSGAVLEYLPEHNVPFAMSRACQENDFFLQKDSTLIASDMVTAGRTARGEVFQYDLYSSKTRIYVDGRLKLYDRSIMDPKAMDMTGLGLMEGYLSSGTIYVYSEKIHDRLPEQLNKMTAEGVSLAAGKIDDTLMTVRFLGSSMVHMKEAADRVWGEIRRCVLGKEPVRVRKY
ncbi:MAG TPA: urease accessory protein UreD [Candidatus Copromorpha excrementigallinarum]|uniref:Urease accessory protein UreD n=1 Tax=Candidatus Allocopromorpha excrementigallinarum TaxID=2840742 RepID=A0A9D1I188_9FIRM|nr:urease accessory protein UreD [Candidatus Copromorpha excrementigallinarum]